MWVSLTTRHACRTFQEHQNPQSTHQIHWVACAVLTRAGSEAEVWRYIAAGQVSVAANSAVAALAPVRLAKIRSDCEGCDAHA